MIETIKEIKSIEHYMSAYEAIDENTDKEFWDKNNFNDDDICFLKHFDDYEYCSYYVINYEYVMVAQCGDIEGDIMTMEEFINETMRLLNEDREEREDGEA